MGIVNEGEVPDTIGVSLGTRESIKRASQNLTIVQIPGYTLTRELGRGSFGTVWKAVREKTGQSVAVKVVNQGETLNWDYFRRELDFLREIEEHPHTLTVLDAQLDNDPPYIVTPLAEGGSLEEAVKREPPGKGLVERWLRQTAEALAFIHRKGVIHCDLKPSNVLLSSSGDVRIGDLGQARRLGHGLALGTIGFMAPEQCEEETRSSPSVSWDVYGFGATAYWLITGKTPLLQSSKELTLEEYMETLKESKLTPILELKPDTDQDLAAIVEACLIADPARRIPSMDAVITDLDRRERHEPLLCRRPWTIRYIAGIAWKRRAVKLALFMLVALLIGTYSSWQNRQENRFLTLVTNGIHAHESGRLEEAYLSWLEALRYRPKSEVTHQRLHFMSLAQIYHHRDRVNDLQLLQGGRTLVTASSDGELALWHSLNGQKLVSFQHPAHLSQVVVSPDESLIATGSWDGSARIFEVKTRTLRHVLSHQLEDDLPSIVALDFSFRGKFLITADLQGRLKLWDTLSGTPQPFQGPPANPEVRQVIASHPSRELIAALVGPSTAAFWDLGTGELLPYRFQHDKEINALEFSEDGRFLVSASDDTKAALWSVETGELVDEFPHETRVNALLVLADSKFGTGCEDGTVSLWRHGEELPLHQFLHRRPVRTLGASLDGKLLAVGTGESEALWSDTEANGMVRLWDLEGGFPLAGPWSHDGPVERVIISPQDSLVLSASGSARQTTAVYPGAVRAWRYYPPSSETATQEAPLSESLGLSSVTLPNGVVLSHGENVIINRVVSHEPSGITATASQDRTVRFWYTASGAQARGPILLHRPAKAIAFSPDGKVLATASEVSPSRTAVRIWEVDSAYPTTPDLFCPGQVAGIEISAEGSTLLVHNGNSIYSWNLTDGPEEDCLAGVSMRLQAKLNERGEVVATEDLSEAVMTMKLP